MRHPRQACHHHAQGHPACPPYPWRACLSSRPPLPSEPIGLFQGHQTKQKEILYSCHHSFQCFRIHLLNMAGTPCPKQAEIWIGKNDYVQLTLEIYGGVTNGKSTVRCIFLGETNTMIFGLYFHFNKADRKHCSYL